MRGRSPGFCGGGLRERFAADHTNESGAPAEAGYDAAAAGGSSPLVATLTAPTHAPKAGEPWAYTIRATHRAGKPIEGTATVTVVAAAGQVIDGVGISPASITATVPSSPGIAYGRWRVTTPAGTAVSDLVFSIPGPTLTGFSPLSGSPGSTVTLTGADLSDVTSISLGLVDTSFTITSPTSITATVPSGGLSYGRWRATNSVGTAVDFDVFTVS